MKFAVRNITSRLRLNLPDSNSSVHPVSDLFYALHGSSDTQLSEASIRSVSVDLSDLSYSAFELLVLSLATFIVLSFLYTSRCLFVGIDSLAEIFFRGVVVIDDDWVSVVVSEVEDGVRVGF